MSSESLSRSEIDAKLRKLDKMLDELRRDYEQFFVGSRDRPPRNERKQVERLVRELEQTQVTNTSQQFRLRSLIQRFSSYRQKWNRIQRQIEQGTYKPHQKRAERRGEEQEAGGSSDSEGGPEADDHVVELDDAELDDIDLEGLEQELQEMDEAGEFEEHVETDRLTEGDLDRVQREREGATGGEGGKREKIRQMQEKLGISTGDGASTSRGETSSKPRRSEEGSGGAAGSDLPTGGAKREDLEKMRENLQQSENRSRRDSEQPDQSSGDSSKRTRHSQRERSRSSSRSSDDEENSSSDDDEETHAERLFRKLVAAKENYGESTEHLTLEAVQESMRRQREDLSAQYDAEEVRFEVVVKDGAVFLQPQLPD